MNHIRVVDEHVTRFHLHHHRRVGRRIRRVDQPAARTKHAGGSVWKDIKGLRTTQAYYRAAADTLPVERHRRSQRARRVIEYVGIVLMVGKFIAGMGRLVDVLDPISYRFIAEKRPHQIEHQCRMEQFAQVGRVLLNAKDATHR